jgi:hypothetical protein
LGGARKPDQPLPTEGKGEVRILISIGQFIADQRLHETVSRKQREVHRSEGLPAGDVVVRESLVE